MISLTPKRTQFFDLLEEYGRHLTAVADVLDQAAGGHLPKEDACKAVISRRNAADVIFDRYIDELHLAFVTPIDRDDLYYLGFAVETLFELTERMVDRWLAFDLQPTEAIQSQLIGYLVIGCRLIVRALPLFRRRALMSQVPEHFRSLRKNERDAELCYRRGLKLITDEVTDTRKWVQLKEGQDSVVAAIRQTKVLADIFHKVIIRNV
ncbi:MAG: hypothetical protein H7338_06410 [Candidatus Sericytochromatia bacterium]|nr:hypothetical protein [Candidatus Sericytochromatia bacterium]